MLTMPRPVPLTGTAYCGSGRAGQGWDSCSGRVVRNTSTLLAAPCPSCLSLLPINFRIIMVGVIGLHDYHNVLDLSTIVEN
ncbi:hypothetical protein E2C01_042152 [Portunus trituberculatus]|uniref:Uncharacterized protein n=1 Tax=Portunus trituberculatus TaxID=210409 RepID=A0A5B7FLR5_PORTR|nr:hypothetical protein [Portunus trituberculatus]